MFSSIGVVELAVFFFFVLLPILLIAWTLVTEVKAKSEAGAILLWFLVELILPYIGFLIWFFVRRPQLSQALRP